MMNARSRLTRSLAVFATGAAIATAGAIFGTANADGVSGVFKTPLGPGLTVHTNTGDKPAYILNLDLDGSSDILQTYCIDIHTSTWDGVAYTEATWAEGSVANLGKVTWVLNHGYPAITAAALLTAVNDYGPDLAGLTQNQAAAATQAAVWHFSDGSNLENPNLPEVVAVYNYLTLSAVATSEPAPSLSILPATLSGPVGERIGPFTVTTSAASVALSATGGIITDAVGTLLATVGNGGTFYITMAGEGSVTISATATATLSSGRVFITTADSPRQKLIAAKSMTAESVVTVEAQATTTTTTQPPATTTTTTQPVVTTTSVAVEPPVVTTTSVVASEAVLPATGRTTASLLAMALGMAMMGGATLMVTRRRPT